ncbi:transposase [Plakobranchus ocellatus]|uniref:Transposase n=1 Tax=Plakobranchus ocellatus TaxID=259542 RepID=A0AAV4CC29_9GAST|nr:transposase [Plakobranchus ocellatus]
MATSNDLLIKQRSVIEFLAAEGCSAANIHARMKTVYSEMCISDCAVRKWYRFHKIRRHYTSLPHSSFDGFEITMFSFSSYRCSLIPV